MLLKNINEWINEPTKNDQKLELTKKYDSIYKELVKNSASKEEFIQYQKEKDDAFASLPTEIK